MEKGAKGAPTFQIGATRQQDRGSERVPDSIYHRYALPELALDYTVSVETRTGSLDPLRDQYEACLIKFWKEDTIKLAIRYGLIRLPERLDPEPITQLQEDMKRHIGAKATQFNRSTQDRQSKRRHLAMAEPTCNRR